MTQIKKLALCIPTYDRIDMVKEFFDSNLNDFLEFDVDIYLFDSWKGDENKKLADAWGKRTKSVYYVSLPEDMHSNRKVFRILSLVDMQKEYKYIWFCGDAVRLKKKAIKRVFDEIDNNYDVIVLDNRRSGQSLTRVFENYEDLFTECGWFMTWYGTVILNTETMLKGVDWKYYGEKQFNGKKINFSHIFFFFNEMSKKENIRACQICLDNYEMKNSELKGRNTWYRDRFFVLCEGWIETVNSLPIRDDIKDKSIREYGRWIFPVEELISLRKNGVYSLWIYLRYGRQLEQLCGYGREFYWYLALTPKNRTGLFREVYRKNEIKKLIKKCYRHDHIVIYGAGKFAGKFASLFCEMSIDFDGFCVSDDREYEKVLNGYPVCTLSEVLQLKNLLLVIGVSFVYRDEIINRLSMMSKKTDYAVCRAFDV